MVLKKYNFPIYTLIFITPYLTSYISKKKNYVAQKAMYIKLLKIKTNIYFVIIYGVGVSIKCQYIFSQRNISDRALLY